MKTSSEKLFEYLTDSGEENPSGRESEDIEKKLNEQLKASMEKMQQDFDQKLKESEEKMSKFLEKEKENHEESNESEEGKRSGADEDQHLSDQE